MVSLIKKRSGKVVPFDSSKIFQAITKASIASGEDIPEPERAKITENIVNSIPDASIPTVEEIQDKVEEALIKDGYAKTAKAYILYRAEHAKIREMDDELMRIMEDLTFKSSAQNEIKRENANIDGDTAMGTMLKYGSESAKAFYHKYILPEHISKAHKCGDIHIHDLDFFTLTETCCQIDLIKLFKNGFSTGHGFLREPNSIGSYAALACIAIQSNQNEQHGGQSIPNFDYAMAPGVAKTYKKLYKTNLIRILEDINGVFDEDESNISVAVNQSLDNLEKEGKTPKLNNHLEFISDITNEIQKILPNLSSEQIIKIEKSARKRAEKETEKATYQAMEALIHNLNTMHSRAGAQIPFSSLNYGTDTTEEGRIVIKNLLLATEAGLGNGETPIFPIQIFKVKEGINFNPGDPNYDLFKLACRVSAKRLFPNFSFLDAPFNLQYYKEGEYNTEVAYMGCRTRVIGNNYDKSKEVTCGRGNLSFTSLNLPRVALESKKNLDNFFEILDERMNLIIEELLYRFQIQCSKKVYNYPFLMGQGIWIDSEKLGPNDSVAEVLKHGTLSMGFIGLAETLKYLIGAHHGESKEAQELGLKIVSYMRNRMDEESKKQGLNFTLLATPAEGLAGRFVKIDRERFGVIEGVTDREYYTNSFHIPVYYPISSFEKIRIEAPYHALTNAGHITYVEMDGDTSANLEAFEKVIRFMKESGIGYGSINHPVDRDPVCGYNGIIGDECPKCHRKEDDIKFERIRRITGYLVGTIDRWNNAKRAEERDRVKHIISK